MFGITNNRRPGMGPKRTVELSREMLPCIPLTESVASEAIGGPKKLSGHDLELVGVKASQESERQSIYTISHIQLSVMNCDTVKKFAVACVNPRDDNRGVIGTPDDPRFGVLSNDEICSTCHLNTMDCPGHFGYIKLNQPFIHPSFIIDAVNILQCFCPNCSSLLFSAQTIKSAQLDRYQGRERWKQISKIVKDGNITCKNSNTSSCEKGRIPCKSIPIYITTDIKDDYKILYYSSKTDKSTKYIRTIDEIIHIFDCISDNDAKLVGFQNKMHPRNLILRNLPVLPPCARPYTFVDGKKRESPLTCLYREDISNHNAKIANAQGEHSRSEQISNLWFKIARLMDNHDGKLKAPDKAIDGIKQYLAGKEGFIRKCNMGKAVNHCGRTVLGPQSKLAYGQVSIPEIMRYSLTIPEKVHARNIDYVSWLLQQGEISYLIPDSGFKGRRYAIKNHNKETYIPQIGDIVDRRLRQAGTWTNPKTGKTVKLRGDVVLFNRQPTLSKHSIQGHEIVVVDNGSKTIGVHMSNTKQYNADFDGDEGNLHILQNRGSQVEASTFASCKANIMSATTNSPIAGIVYNGLTSCYLMTQPLQPPEDDEDEDEDDETEDKKEEEKKPIVLDEKSSIEMDDDEWKEALSVLTYKLPDDFEDRCSKMGISPRSGKALFSTLLPNDFWYEKSGVKIRNGILIEGTIKKAHIGVSGGAIQQSIWKTYGMEASSQFISNCTYLSDWFIYNHGFTVSYADIELKTKVDLKVKRSIQQSRVEIQLKIDEQNTSDMTPLELEHFEQQICVWVNTLNKEGGKIVKLLKPNNPFVIMQLAGAKGSAMNTAQIMGLLGQQFIKGSRPICKMSNGTRILPYFLPNSKDIRAYGYCSHSFFTGLTPVELFFHAMGTRTNLVDTGVSTADVGYLSHRLMKVMEDVSARYDGTIRNADNTIMLACNGAGYDPGEMVNVNSRRFGDASLVTFIDLRETVSRLNQKYGILNSYQPTI